MKISNNFKLSEFERSEKATLFKIDNSIPKNLIPNIESLVKNVLQPICDFTGWKDFISSGYRCEALNIKVGGEDNSQHLKGEAADNKYYIMVGKTQKYIPVLEVLKAVKDSNVVFDQCIVYPTFVHLSYTERRKNRMQILYSKSFRK